MMALVLVFLGLVFALTTITSRFMSFIMIFLWGLIFGRLWYRLKGKFKFPWLLMIIGFLIGFIIANAILQYKNTLILVALYFFGMWLSYYIHEKKLLESTEY